MATFAIDSAHTDVLFSAKHMMVTTVRGTFTRRVGHDRARRGRPHGARSAEIVVRTASVDTGFGARDNAPALGRLLRCRDRTRRSASCRRSVRPKGGNDYVVTADVTIRDVTRPVDFDVEFLGFYPAWTARAAPASRAKATVNRKDWGLDWNVALEAGGWLVGDKVKLEVDVAVAGGAGRRRVESRSSDARRSQDASRR